MCTASTHPSPPQTDIVNDATIPLILDSDSGCDFSAIVDTILVYPNDMIKKTMTLSYANKDLTPTKHKVVITPC